MFLGGNKAKALPASVLPPLVNYKIKGIIITSFLMSLYTFIDYNTTIATFTYNMGSTKKCATIYILDDNKLETTERFNGHLTTPDVPLITVNPNKTQVDIMEDSNDGKESQSCEVR